MFLLILTACEQTPNPEPIVIYATAEHAERMQSVFDAFTEEKGIPVSLKFGASGVNTQSVIDNQGAPPADLLLTDNIADIWHAADRGALRPINSERTDNWPANLLDADQLWIALNTSQAAIALSDPTVDAPPATFEALADPTYRGQLCLSAASLPLNRSLIAMMIETKGARPTELVVRGWVQNLAVAPYATESLLRQAVASGTSRYAIVEASPDESIALHSPEVSEHLADAIGVARHARYPNSAQLFIDWLLSSPPGSTRGDVNIGSVGYRDTEAQQLAERARYR